ncbi:MAG: hypothetical protein WAO00_03905 [Chthoniobacterales bacterium]
MTRPLLPPAKGMLLGLLVVIWMASTASSQDSPTPTATPSPAARSVRISFVPPPLDGTISLGIYDAKGRLVRVLFREADINEFTIGHDALSTTWDGKDDAGENVPAGKYSAHGFVVGDLKIEGVGFSFNDWISSPDTPRFFHIHSLDLRDDDLFLGVDLVPPGMGHVLYNLSEKTIKLKDTDSSASPPPLEPGPGDIDPVMTIAGRDGTRWVIDRTEKISSTTELKQFSATGEFLRRLPVSPNDPQPRAVAASKTEDKIYLLEENSASQRVRGLSLVATKTEGAEQPVSEWKVDFEKWIWSHKDFSVVDGKPVASSAQSNTPEKVKVKLQPNPLLNEDRVTLEVAVGLDADGSFLKTADGLPLCTVSETQELIRALVNPHGVNVIDVFQDDGAVVEQFRVSGVDQMLSFDCGGFELK